MFKKSFKKYKSKCPPPDLTDVIDFRSVTTHQISGVKEHPLKECNDTSRLHMCGLRPVSTWKVYEMTSHPGAMLITNPFTEAGLRYWSCRCLSHYTSRSVSRRNLDIHNDLSEGEEWWDVCNRDSNTSQLMLQRLRWATLGYHHNWDTKEYSEQLKGPFPKDLAALSQHIAAGALGIYDYQAQAAIINFYPIGSTLAGHTDHSEKNLTAPLLSFSFGCSAVFLLGGLTIDDEPVAMCLNSGDILVMSGHSRLCYHGVPRILPAPNKICTQGDSSSAVCEYCKEVLDAKVMLKCSDKSFWEPFSRYIFSSRINMNVRQVLKTGQSSLDDTEDT